MRFTACAVQFEPRLADRDWNMERLIRLTTEAAAAGARLVVLPEMATTGYCFHDRKEIAPFVETVPDGPTVQTFADLAMRHSIHIVVGLPELDPSTGAFYNTAVLVGPKGYVGHYRKTHAFIDETRWARDGDLGIPVFETELGRIAIQICMDGDYFEPTRVAALAGADVIAFPTNWLGGRLPWRARAVENGVYMVCADRWGIERGNRFAGYSTVIDPYGTAMGELAAGDGLVLVEVDTDLARSARTAALAARHPEHYHELLLSSYLWRWEEAQRLPAGRQAVVAAADGVEPSLMADQARWADKQARDKGWPKLDLIVFPNAGVPWDSAELAATAVDLNCHMVWGSTDGEGYQTAWLVGPNGLEGSYRAIHPEEGAMAGREGLAVFDLSWGRVGMLLGHELRLPESTRILAKLGADLIAAPASWDTQSDRFLWSVRSAENETALAVANAFGGSAVYVSGRRPRNVNSVGSVALCLLDTASSEVRNKELLRKLQPRWYDPLVSR